MRKSIAGILLLGSVCGAQVLWEGDPSQGLGVFKIKNTEGSATVTAETDPQYGPIWKFYKPGSSDRCEMHGAKGIDSKEGSLIYIGWSSKLSMPQNTKLTGIFQFKSYPPGNGANFPLLLRPMDGSLVLESYDANKHSTRAWAAPLETEKWFSIVIVIKESKDPAQGYIELYYNGQPQVLHGGATRMAARTLDGGYTDPKWGLYHSNNSANMTNLVRGLRIGSDYASVAQGASTAIRIVPKTQSSLLHGKETASAIVFKDLIGRELGPLRPATGRLFAMPR